MRFRVNTPSVIYEVLNGDAVLLNLDQGIYYTLNGPGGEIWALIEAHYSSEEISAAFDSNQDQILSFLSELETESLIVPLDSAQEVSLEPLEKRPFAPPVLHVYLDMQNLLFVDPIHEVDQAGWPVAPR